jgi:4-hydroxyacetophenone monooxygenase
MILGSDQYNVLIIGAGMSGLDIAKKLKDIGVPFIILEKAPHLGRTW